MNEEHIKSNFKDHALCYSKYVKIDPVNQSILDDIEVLHWRKKGTICYSILYIRKGNSLFVTGDLGEAIYCWNDCNDLLWISDLDLQYFASKCMASESGRGYKDWDDTVALEKIKQYMKEQYEDDYKKILEKFEDNGGDGACCSEKDWNSWLDEYGDEIFGDCDWWEWAPSVGVVISFRCECHLVGLKMAMGQLAEKQE